MKSILVLILLAISVGSFSQGSEMITDGDFSSATNWTAGTGVTIADGIASFDGTTWALLRQYDGDMVSSIDTSTVYTIKFYVSNSTSAYFEVRASSISETYIESALYENGSYEIIFTSPSDIGDGGICFRSNSEFDLDSVSLIETAAIGDSPYYVATDGDDASAGDINNPWAGLNRAFTVAEPGDTVYVRGGTYYMDEGIELAPGDGVGNLGEDTAWIYYLNYPEETPIFDWCNFIPTESTQFTAFGVRLAAFTYFRGLTVCNLRQGDQDDSISVFGFESYGAANITFDQCVAHNIGGRGFGFFGGFGAYHPDSAYPFNALPDVSYDTMKYINCDSYTNCDSLFIGSYQGGLADGWKGNNAKGAMIYYYGCRAWNNSDDGFDPNGSATIQIENCWSFLNGYLDGDGYGVKTIGINANVTSYGQPHPDTVVRKFYNNIFAFNRLLGISLGMREYYYLPPTEFYNNIAYRNQDGFIQGQYHYGLDCPVIYRNNIAYDNIYDNVVNAGTFQGDHNSFNMGYPWEDTISISAADFVLVDSAQAIAELTASRKADGSLPDITFLTLATGSDLINAGIDVGFDYIGIAPDLGPSEYGSGSDTVDVETITISAAGSATTISVNNGTLQMSAAITPDTASFQSVTWSTHSGTGSGTITSGGLVQAVDDGTDTIRATAQDGTGIYDDYILTYSNQNALTTPTVTTSTAIGTGYYITAGGNATSTGGASITAKGICWSTSENPTLSDGYTVDGTGTGSYTSTPLNLQPWTTYYIRAYATNSEGTSYGGNRQATPLFTTKPMKVSPSGSPIFRGGKVVTK